MTPSHRHVAFVAALAVSGALLAMPMFVHSDDGDAQLYQVLVRHMLEDGTWTDLRYEPNVHPRYREHLPFGLWPYRVAAQLFGEGAMNAVAFLFGLGILATTGLLARRLYGDGAGIAAVLVLGLTESFYDIAGRTRLDGPLVLFALLAAVPVLLKRSALWSLPFAIIAVLIKGPFGLVPLVAACLVMRAWRGLAVALLATLPAALWLWTADVSWWLGYVDGQLLASASGARTDGESAFYVPFRVLVGRFWPGLPLVVWAATKKELRVTLLWSLAMLLLLCLPGRKLWFHTLVAFPALAVTAGGAAAKWLEHRRVAFTLAGLAVTVWIADALGLPKLIGKQPYVYCSELPAYPPGTRALAVGGWPWHAIASLAADRKYVMYRAQTLDEFPDVHVAFVDDTVLPKDLGAWTTRAHAPGWTLLERP